MAYFLDVREGYYSLRKLPLKSNSLFSNCAVTNYVFLFSAKSFSVRELFMTGQKAPAIYDSGFPEFFFLYVMIILISMDFRLHY